MFNSKYKLFAASLMTTVLMSACTGSGDNGNDTNKPQTPPAQPAAVDQAKPEEGDKAQPADTNETERKAKPNPNNPLQISGETDLTFEFGGKEAVAFEMEKEKESNEFGIRRYFIANENAIYFFREDPKVAEARKTDKKIKSVYCLYKRPFTDRTFGEAELIDENVDPYFLTTNGKDVYYIIRPDAPACYDGSKIHHGQGFKTTTKHPAYVDGKNLLYYDYGDMIYKATVKEDGSIENEMPFINVAESPELKDNGGFGVAYAYPNSLFVLVYKKVDGKDIEFYYEFDNNGKFVRSYEGLPKNQYDWAVTDDYVIATGNGVFKIYDRSDGLLMEEVKTPLHASRICHVAGNEVMIYDNASKKIYRIFLF